MRGEQSARLGPGGIGRHGLIVAILLVALAARLIALAADAGHEPRNDAYDFHRHAASLAAGDGYPEAIYSGGGGESAFRPPGYPFFLAAIYAVAGAGDGEVAPVAQLASERSDIEPFRDAWSAARLANVGLGVVVVLLIYLIALRLWGERVALISGGIAAVFPPLVLLATELMSESLFVPIELGAVLAVLVFRDRRTMRWAALAGLLAGLATLTRANGVVLIPLVMLGVWVLRPRLTLDALAAPALALLVAALVISPWTLRNYVVTGRFIPVTTQLGFGLAGTYNQSSLEDEPDHAPWQVPSVVEPYSGLFLPSVDEPTLHGVLREESTDFALEHPGYVVEATLWNTLRTFDLAAPGVYVAGDPVRERGVGVSRSDLERIALSVLIVLALVGVVVLARRLPIGRETATRAPVFLWLTPLLLLASVIPAIGLPRYRATADPFLIMLAAIGIAYLWERLRPPMSPDRASESDPA